MAASDTARTGSATVGSRWWVLVAATTVYGVVAVFLLVLFVPLVLLAALSAAPGDPPAVAGLSLAGLALVVVPLVLVGVLLTVLFPVAIYVDAEAVAAADLGWRPDPALYALVGVAGLVAGGAPVQPAVGLYYLYRRHQHVGRP